MPQNDAAAFWNERFAQKDYYYGKRPNDFLRQQIGSFAPASKILSLGEGEGRNAVFLAQHGHQVTALDAAQAGLEKAKQLAAEHHVAINTIQTQLQNYRLEPNQWDGIIAIFCHLPAPLRQQVHEQIKHSLTPGGIFLLEAYTPKQLEYGTGGPKNIDLLYDPEVIKKELSGLEMLHFEEVERDIHEGLGHRGLSSVLQIVARKT